MQNVDKLIEDIENAMFALQDYFNHEPKEYIKNYIGTCENEGSLKIYQLRCEFAKHFSKTQSYPHGVDKEDYVEFLKDFFSKDTAERLGHAFCRKFKIHNPELAYSTDLEKTSQIIKTYLKESCPSG